jgi:hypothetical protein
MTDLTPSKCKGARSILPTLQSSSHPKIKVKIKVRPLQARGEHNSRHFDEYIFQLPIPLYDHNVPQHRNLAELAEHAEQAAYAVELPSGIAFQALRRRIRAARVAGGIAQDIDGLLEALLSGTPDPT